MRVKLFKDFFVTNNFIRKIKIFIQTVFLPKILKLSLILLALIILTCATLYFFKPEYLTKFSQRLSSYCFQKLGFNSNSFVKINVEGNVRVKSEEVIEVINKIDRGSKNSQFLNQDLINEIKTQLPWVHKVVINRNMPNTLNITITEYVPFAIWQNADSKFIIDKDGNTVPFVDSEEFHDMVILSGLEANTHAKSLFNIFVIDPSLSVNVYSATWLGNRRWDIRFNDGLLVKLPESNINRAWQSLIKIYNTPGLTNGLRVVDLRLEDKIYLEYKDAVLKEITTL